MLCIIKMQRKEEPTTIIHYYVHYLCDHVAHCSVFTEMKLLRELVTSCVCPVPVHFKYISSQQFFVWVVPRCFERKILLCCHSPIFASCGGSDCARNYLRSGRRRHRLRSMHKRKEAMVHVASCYVQLEKTRIVREQQRREKVIGLCRWHTAAGSTCIERKMLKKLIVLVRT